MKREANIRYVTRVRLDTRRWDGCIDYAGGYPIYGYSFYLDAMSRQWDALVLNDYEAVMPLVWNKKMGFYYLFQPFLTPQLGIIGRQVDGEMVQAFLKAIPERFAFWEMNLNRNNVYDLPEFELEKKVNYTLPLQPYSVIAAHYNSNLKRNLKKAVAAGCEYKENIPLHEAMHLAEQQLKQYTRFKKDDISQFKALSELLLHQQKAQVIGVYHDGMLCATCIFFFHHQRAYYILAATHPSGKKLGASHFLLDRFIEKQAGQNQVLDFVGSDIPTIAFFYESFGGLPETYASVRLNRLPLWIRWAKE